jgi:thiosulfate dehydrogenase [quinone] large subunit
MKNNSILQTEYTGWKVFSLTFLRILIGWHFLYEGMVKILASPAWTAGPYLSGSVGPFAPVFKAMVSNDTILMIVDNLNIWGLIIVGLCLFIGLFSKPSAISGIILLALYYLAYPPFPVLSVNAPVEGSYWIVNKNLIEIAALIVLYLFPSGQITGIDRYISGKGRAENRL